MTTYPIDLRGARVRLRELEASDLEPVLDFASDLDVMYWTVGRAVDRAEELQWISAAGEKAREEPRAMYALAIEAEDRLVGTITLDVESIEHSRGHLGYALHKQEWGKGYATDAARLLIDFGLKRLGLHRIYATLDVRNDRSRRVLEKAGMVLEGTLRGFMRKHDGWCDSYIYSILSPDVPA